jgi:TrpR-related protein YerC/YecD
MIAMARARTSDGVEVRGRPAAPRAGSLEALPGLDELADAILTLRTRDEVRRFLRDLCTLPELEALTHRWETARLVDRGVPYLEIAERVPTSTATVTRVAQWVRHGEGGYRLVLDRQRRRRS